MREDRRDGSKEVWSDGRYDGRIEIYTSEWIDKRKYGLTNGLTVEMGD